MRPINSAKMAPIRALELTRARLVLGTWVNRSVSAIEAETGTHCLATAYQVSSGFLTNEQKSRATAALYKACKERGYETLAAYNDQPTRTKTEIESLLDRAIEIVREHNLNLTA